jgi:hypothetical protein
MRLLDALGDGGQYDPGLWFACLLDHQQAVFLAERIEKGRQAKDAAVRRLSREAVPPLLVRTLDQCSCHAWLPVSEDGRIDPFVVVLQDHLARQLPNAEVEHLGRIMVSHLWFGEIHVRD